MGRSADRFTRSIENVEDEATATSLDRLRALHGLATIRKNLGWYQEHGHLSGATARSVRKLHDRLVGEIAPESLALVEAFAIPDRVLGAPIATIEPARRTAPQSGDQPAP